MRQFTRNNNLIKIFVSFSLIVMGIIFAINFSTKKASADIPYKTYTIDGYGYVSETQTAYTPHSSITKVGDLALSGPRDMMITDNDEIYIADTGNKRIIVSDLDGNLIKEFGSDILVNPCGLFVTEDNHTYVADSDAGQIFVFDSMGELINSYGRPNHPLYGDTMDFKPLKIVVNNAGNMFIVSEANTNGIVQISPTSGGTFLGYFGANYASASIRDVLLRLLLTDSQRAKMVSNLPATPDNMAIDDKGLIYTVTRGDNYETLKRLNIAGKNLIDPDSYDSYPSAVASGNYDNVYMASSEGYIYEFNNEGELLFVFGGSDDGRQRIGLSKKVEAIDVDGINNIYLLDSDMNQIQVFAPTEFTNLLHNALYLYSKGRYTESKEPLEEILEINSLFDYANKAIARAYLQEEDYSTALHYSKLAKDFSTYSDAFWEMRNLWLRDNIVTLIGLIILIIILTKILKMLQSKYGLLDLLKSGWKKAISKPFIGRLNYSKYFIRHPIDGCYGVRWEGKASYVSSTMILFIFIVISVVDKYFTGFLLKTVREGRYNIVSDVGTILAVFLLMTACSYLICTINDGEGTLRQLYSGFLYCLTPYIILQPIIFLLSHVVTYNEVFLVSFSKTLMNTWIIVLIFITIKEINNYSIKETLKVIGLTFFAALIAVLVIFILYILWSQVFDFALSICGEVVYRLGF